MDKQYKSRALLFYRLDRRLSTYRVGVSVAHAFEPSNTHATKESHFRYDSLTTRRHAFCLGGASLT